MCFSSPSFRQGLETLGVLEKMQLNPEAFRSILCDKPEKLSAKLLGDLFTNHSLPGADTTRTLDFWMGYLQETAGKRERFLSEFLNYYAESFLCMSVQFYFAVRLQYQLPLL